MINLFKRKRLAFLVFCLKFQYDTSFTFEARQRNSDTALCSFRELKIKFKKSYLYLVGTVDRLQVFYQMVSFESLLHRW